MKYLAISTLLAAMAFIASMTPARAGTQITTTTLSSIEELDRLFGHRSDSKPIGGVQYFVAQRYAQPYFPNAVPREAWRPPQVVGDQTLVRFDRARLEIVPFFTAEQEARVVGGDGHIGEFVVDDQGNQLAIDVPKPKPGGGNIVDIVVVDVQQREVRFRFSDGHFNYHSAFSPDGRYVAFYSTAPEMDMDPEKPIEHSAGRVIDLATSQSMTFTEPFVDKGQWVLFPPLWLDAERVLFRTFCADKTLIVEQVKDFGGDKCPCIAIAAPASGNVKRLMVPHGKRPPEAYLDARNARLILSDGSTYILSTNLELEDVRTIRQVDGIREGLRVSLPNGIREDGSVSYEVYDAAEQRAKNAEALRRLDGRK